MRVPNSGCSAAAMSPTAKMSASLVRSVESTRTPPSPSARPACSASAVLGAAPTATRTASASTVEPSPSLSPVALPPSVVISLHRCPEPKVDAVFAVQGGEHLADLAAERRHQRQLSHFDDGDVDAAVSGTGGDLEADPPTADDGQ